MPRFGGGRGGYRPPQRRPNRPANRGATDALRGPPTAVQPRRENVPVTLPSRMTVKELGEALRVQAGEVIKGLLNNGMMATINQQIDYDTAAIVAVDLGFVPTETTAPTMESTALGQALTDEAENLESRPPVVTIMGHVDHGKTSLLDAIRQTSVATGEAGGITQHIGAYQVEHTHAGRRRKITFLDTPGHEAFTQMRARGAQATDIAILVIAADDGAQPQTIEAISHIKAAKVPMIVALNKIDVAGANPDRVRTQLAEHEVVVEQFGGDTPSVEVSARNKQGIEDLLEVIELVAELQELKANPNRAARGLVIEAKLDRARGPISTLLVQTGTLNVGDTITVGPHFGRVRAMFDYRGKGLRHADPATPVEILGLSDVPQAGDRFAVAPDERTARSWAQEQLQIRQATRGDQPQARASMTLEDLMSQQQAGAVKELNVIVKTDVQGSADPIRASVETITNDEVKVKVLLASTGNVNDSDVNLAIASRAIVVAFNVRVEPGARRVADNAGVDIRTYSVIYEIVEDIEAAVRGMAEPKYQTVLEGSAEVRQLFKVGRETVIAGSYIVDGRITRQSLVTVRRGGRVLVEGARLSNLKRFKDEVREVTSGYECGITVEDFNDFQPADVIEAYARERIA